MTVDKLAARSLVLAAALAACDTGPGVTGRHLEMVRAIEAQGYKDVELHDWGQALAWDGCGHDDPIVAHGSATNALGARVGIIACSGYFWKGVTIRTR